MNKELITVILRAIIQAVAGALAVRGVSIDDGSIEIIVAGIVAALTIVWSVKEKAKIKSETTTITKP